MATSVTDKDKDDCDPERHTTDLYIRTGWTDANVALDQLEKGKAKGDRSTLWVRSRLQDHFHSFGSYIDTHAGKVLFVSVLVIGTFCVGLKSATFHTSIDQLWVSDGTGTSNNMQHDVQHSESTAHLHNTNHQPQDSSDLLSSHQMIIQTTTDPEGGLLNPRGLLEHLSLVQQATQVTVTLFDITWRLKDLCQAPSVPSFDAHIIEQLFENIIPCSIITPLDCFWEGAKLLGPDYPVTIPHIGYKVKWTKINPIKLVEDMKRKKEYKSFDYHTLENYLRRAGITTGYQEKPCLNPKDPECPMTSPNKNTSTIPDIGAELTSGCYGFAAKYMHWPEDLLVGGSFKNKTGHIKQAKALQTVVQLMGAHEMYEFWASTYKVQHIGWTQDKAALVLEYWQKKFAQEVKRLTSQNITSPMYQFHTFSCGTLNDSLKQYSNMNLLYVALVFLIVLIYSWVVDSWLSVMGAILLVGSTTAGLGLCSLLGFSMNVLSVQVLPYFCYGLALRDVYLLTNTFDRCQQTSEILKRSALIILITAATSAIDICTAAIIPVPILRVFALQCAILIILNTAALLLVFPALVSLEIRCKKAALLCFGTSTSQKPAPANNNNEHQKNLLNTEITCSKKNTCTAKMISKYITSFIFNSVMRIVLCLSYTILIIFFILNTCKLEYELNLSVFLPKNTQEYNYLEAQNKFFGFYNFYLVTTEFEYPLNQQLLYEYHSSLSKVPNILKDSNGGLNMNDFWLANFRDFLIDLQGEFDTNLANNCLNDEKWFPNATEKAVLAYKLLSQTGIVEYPVDKGQILKKKLVTNGIIDPRAFYNYLSVWSTNDQLSYSSSKSNLNPKPLPYYNSKMEVDLKIPRSQPLVYTQMPFYLKNLRSTSKIVDTLKHIRKISDDYNKKGLKNYPLGLIFAYFDQFLMLDYMLLIQLHLIALVTIVSSIVLIKWTKIWCKIFSISISLLVLSLFNINAMTAVFIAIHCILVGRNVTLVLTGFLQSIGNKERRIKLSLELNCCTILKGDIALCICISMWAFSEFTFIRSHLLYVVAMSVVSAIANGFVFFPVVLSLFGPVAEIQPLEHSDRISTPPPSQTPVTARPEYKKPPRRSQPQKATREPSLTTITEESCNQSVVQVQSEVVVEYSNPNDSGSSLSVQYPKVTATANIKVEVMPMYKERAEGRSRLRDDNRVMCHRVVCSDGRDRKESRKTKCKNSERTERCNVKKESSCRSSRRYRDNDCQGHHDSCRHTCCDDERDRRYCDSDRHSARHQHDSDSSDSENEKSKCWRESEKYENNIQK